MNLYFGLANCRKLPANFSAYFSKVSSRAKLYTPPPPPPFLTIRHFSGEGGGGVYSEAPRGRNFIRPPPPFIHPPPLEGSFQGWGGVYKIWPRISGSPKNSRPNSRPRSSAFLREGVNREKLTVKKIINNEIFVFVFSPFMSLINREKLCVNREKSAPKIHHFFTVSFSPFTSS